jgi:serine kinase of HPr protein (carbohydrate metabolism regulator)
MKIAEIAETLGLEVMCGRDSLEKEVSGGYTGDLLSDVMGNSREGFLWITRQIHQNIVAVASLKELAGIILINSCQPAQETMEKAEAEKIPILVSDLPAFELSGKVYNLLAEKNS